ATAPRASARYPSRENGEPPRGAHMAQEGRKVVQLPILKGSSIDDALAGFATQIEQNTGLGRRTEQAITAVTAEIRGWSQVADRIGADPAGRLLTQVLERAIESLESAGGDQVAIGGAPAVLIVSVSFSGEQHAMSALVAA